MSAETHDCERDRCVGDKRTMQEIEDEGSEAAARGLGLSDCPYGRTHPDIRFNAWVRGNGLAWSQRAKSVFADGYYGGYGQALAHAGLAPCGKPAEGGPCYLAPGHPGVCYARAVTP